MYGRQCAKVLLVIGALRRSNFPLKRTLLSFPRRQASCRFCEIHKTRSSSLILRFSLCVPHGTRKVCDERKKGLKGSEVSWGQLPLGDALAMPADSPRPPNSVSHLGISLVERLSPANLTIVCFFALARRGARRRRSKPSWRHSI